MIIYDVSYFSLNPSAFSPQKKHQTLRSTRGPPWASHPFLLRLWGRHLHRLQSLRMVLRVRRVMARRHRGGRSSHGNPVGNPMEIPWESFKILWKSSWNAIPESFDPSSKFLGGI